MGIVVQIFVTIATEALKIVVDLVLVSILVFTDSNITKFNISKVFANVVYWQLNTTCTCTEL